MEFCFERPVLLHREKCQREGHGATMCEQCWQHKQMLVMVVYHPPNCTSMLLTVSWCECCKMFQIAWWKTPSTKVECFMESVKDLKLRKCFASATSWWQVMQLTVVNYICQWSCGCEFVIEADLGSGPSIGDENNAFHYDWVWLGTEKNVNFSAVFSASLTCAVIVRVTGTVKKRDVFLNQCWALPE